jgi:hypothetical protein
MEYMRGTKLSDAWLELGESDILYYAHDLKKMAERAAIPLKDERFCAGPDTRLPMWYGRRSQLDVDRRPCTPLSAVLKKITPFNQPITIDESAEAGFAAATRKELAYLEQFGQPLLPFRRERRDGYQYQEQSPSAHIQNLKRYLLTASSLVPRDPALGRFCIRHPDLQQSNIVVRGSSDSGWQVVSLLDWQHASIMPPFLLAGVPLTRPEPR